MVLGDGEEFLAEFEPVEWSPDGERTIHSMKRNHGVDGKYELYNIDWEKENDPDYLDQCILEYMIRSPHADEDLRYNLFSVRDLMNMSQINPHKKRKLEKAGKSENDLVENRIKNLPGYIAERLARRVTKYSLNHMMPSMKAEGIYDERYNPYKKEYVVRNSENYVLKIAKHPNLVILKQEKGFDDNNIESEKFGYRIKELDGLFYYRLKGKKQFFVLESKIEQGGLDEEVLAQNLFDPLKELFPDSKFNYILFSTRNAIYDDYAIRKIGDKPKQIFERLKQEDIRSFFFTFKETYGDFMKMSEHILNQHRFTNNLEMTLYNETVISKDKIIIKDYGRDPMMVLEKTDEGTWKEVRPRKTEVIEDEKQYD